MRALVAFAFLAPLLLACESVPDIAFSNDSPGDAGDAGVTGDAGASDVAVVGDAADAAATGCQDGGPGIPPPPATFCCANGWACSGPNCNVVNCDYCAMHCSAASPICCTKPGASNPQCKPVCP